MAFERRETGNAKITKNDIMKAADKAPNSVTPEEVEQIEEWAKERRMKT
ncbi:MAG: hypothetical protein OCU20_05835 [Methanophagales archaeon]|nr:hypothetical protein [Methanophagales archaeon]MCW7073390.1 hypothetical protein [Methanophagales archaeon]